MTSRSSAAAGSPSAATAPDARPRRSAARRSSCAITLLLHVTGFGLRHHRVVIERVGFGKEIRDADNVVSRIGELLLDQLGFQKNVLQYCELLRRGPAPLLAAG